MIVICRRAETDPASRYEHYYFPRFLTIDPPPVRTVQRSKNASVYTAETSATFRRLFSYIPGVSLTQNIHVFARRKQSIASSRGRCAQVQLLFLDRQTRMMGH